MRPLSEVQGPLLDALDVAQRFGFLGPKDIGGQLDHSVAFASIVDRLCDRLRNPAAVAPPAVAQVGIEIVDLGSGGGIPGMVIAALLPDARVQFVDSSQKRMGVLQEQLERLGLLPRCSVICGRAESFAGDATRKSSVDVVVARGFAGPAVTAECAAPLLRPGGFLVVSDGPDESVDRWPAQGLARLGLGSFERVQEPFHFFVGRLVAACPSTYPRRVGIPEKRPLF